jgi:High potential iron-sulfur protein
MRACDLHQTENKIMFDKKDLSPIKVSRRSVLLHGAACATGAATILVANVDRAMAAKMPQPSVAYQPKPKGDRNCSNCKFFEPPNACQKVSGDISPDGWCLLWQKKA